MGLNRQTKLLFIFFGVIYSLISLVNHYLFRTYAWDLGIFNNAIYDYAHFRFNDCMLMQPQWNNLLGDHFVLILFPISFLHFLTGSYTLLIFQIVMILIGGLGIHRYFNSKFNNKDLAFWAVFHFFSIWGIYSALAFDYHNNVVAAMLVPWVIYFFEKGSYVKYFVFLVLIWFCKENMAFWAAFISLGLGLLYFRNRKALTVALITSALSLIYFLAVIKLIIPLIEPARGGYVHFKFNALGTDFEDAIINILRNPSLPIRLLFENQSGLDKANWIKTELHIAVILSGGVFLLFRPQFLVMLIPIFAQKLFNDDPFKWGLNYHYSIEFVPILTIAVYSVIGKWSAKLKSIAMVFFAILTLATTIKFIDARRSIWYHGKSVRFYAAHHFKQKYDVKVVYDAMDMVPENAALSATSTIVPHMAFRDKIYHFPVVNDADYILINSAGSIAPLTEAEMETEVMGLKSDNDWNLIFNKDNIYLFKRK